MKAYIRDGEVILEPFPPYFQNHPNIVKKMGYKLVKDYTPPVADDTVEQTE